VTIGRVIGRRQEKQQTLKDVEKNRREKAKGPLHLLKASQTKCLHGLKIFFKL
jgi:hypothetical protein